jgi:2-oxoglutarate dehydrogenase E2 component (dihydrolipoamide succinyltransferase)
MPTDIVVPNLGESIVEATVANWLKQEGDPVKVGEAVVELETDKVNLEVGAETDGVLAKILHQPGADVKIGDVLGQIDESAAPVEKTPPTEEVTKEAPVEESAEKVTPVARRLAQEHGIDPAQVTASGPRGRVTKEDIERHITGRERREEPKVPAPREQPQMTAPALLPRAQDGHRREERIRMSRRRRTIAQRLGEAQRTAAMLTTFNEVDMTAVMELRTRRKESFKELYGVGLGITSFFVKAVIGALKVFPRLNAEIDEDDIILKYYYDIGIAVGASEGLVVPVLRDAERMSFADIEKAIKEYAQQAENGTLSLEDLLGGTFTITNGGVFGSLMSTPILNPPQVGILGLHKIEQRPVALNGEIVIRPMMYVALSYDHRIVDGNEAVRFLVRIKELVEDPEALLLEG